MYKVSPRNRKNKARKPEFRSGKETGPSYLSLQVTQLPHG